MLFPFPGTVPSMSPGRLPREATLKQPVFKVLLPWHILLYSMQPLLRHNRIHWFTFSYAVLLWAREAPFQVSAEVSDDT